MRLDPEIAALVDTLRSSGAPALHELTPGQARSAMARVATGGPEVREVADHRLISADGGTFSVRVLRPADVSAGVLVYCPGGGWMLGGVDASTVLGRELAIATGFTVVVVGYRKAPEDPFPAAMEDCWSALQWASTQIPALCGQPRRLVVLGDSSGGNLAALATLRARDRGGEVAVDLQVLIYPVTDCDLDRQSYLEPDNQLILTRDTMAWFWEHYLAEGARRALPDASPLRNPDLRGLPATAIATAEYDVLRDEGEAYADALEAAGVPVHRRSFGGLAHGFFTMVDALSSWVQGAQFINESIEWEAKVARS